MKQTETPNNCIKCNRQELHSGWLYIWNGVGGNTCEDCGKFIHAVGDYLSDKAADIFTKNGIQVDQVKEKFGYFRIYSSPQTEEHERVIRETLDFYRKSYPEFSWDF